MTKSKLSSIKTASSYRRLVIGFSVAVLLMLALIIYFSFSRTVITITPQALPQETTATISLVSADLLPTLSAPAIEGNLIATTITKTSQTVLEGEGEPVPDNATGTVTIYNTWTQVQPLAATTRLLSPDGILFRIKDRVDVPAGGSITDVEVYADEAGPQGNIKPTRFTIPGLWAGLQDQIYAVSTEPMTGGMKSVTTLTQQDVANARNDMIQDMLIEAVATLSDNDEVLNRGMSIDPDTIATTILSTTSDPETGASASTFSLTVEARFVAALFDLDALTAQLVTQAAATMPEHNRILDDPAPSISYTIQDYNLEESRAAISATLTQYAIPRLDNPIFDRSKLTGKDRTEIEAYFSNFDEIKSVTTRFSPFWVTTSPSLTDHIEIKLTDPQ
ncbi:MAG: hypothetical protein ACOYUK_03670 [Patescibacteria group bacterium]